jgi:hypothetical protein
VEVSPTNCPATSRFWDCERNRDFASVKFCQALSATHSAPAIRYIRLDVGTKSTGIFTLDLVFPGGVAEDLADQLWGLNPKTGTVILDISHNARVNPRMEQPEQHRFISQVVFVDHNGANYTPLEALLIVDKGPKRGLTIRERYSGIEEPSDHCWCNRDIASNMRVISVVGGHRTSSRDPCHRQGALIRVLITTT